jgi:hypothetical protein
MRADSEVDAPFIDAQFSRLQREPHGDDWWVPPRERKYSSRYRYALDKAVAQIDRKFGLRFAPMLMVRRLRITWMRPRERRPRRATAKARSPGRLGDDDPEPEPPLDTPLPAWAWEADQRGTYDLWGRA